MLTILSVPHPFHHEADIIRQRNAITSWTLIKPEPEIILMGSDEGVKEITEEFDTVYHPFIAENELGMLSTKSIFDQGQEMALNGLMLYIDCDTILMSDFMPVVRYVDKKFDDFVLMAGRWGVKVPTLIEFDDTWEARLTQNLKKRGKYHRRGSDWFVFRRGFYKDMPPFSIGKGHWDGWKMGYALKRGAPLIDASDVCKVVHEDHGMRWSGHPATGVNLRLCGDCIAWVHDATVKLKKGDIDGY